MVPWSIPVQGKAVYKEKKKKKKLCTRPTEGPDLVKVAGVGAHWQLCSLLLSHGSQDPG